MRSLLLVGFLVATACNAQAVCNSGPVSPQRFDIYTIRPSTTGELTMNMGWRGSTFFAENMSLEMLMANSFGFRQGTVTGLPKWAVSQRWDVMAKISDADAATVDSMNREARGAAQRAFLCTAFRLKVHPAPTMRSIFELTPSTGKTIFPGPQVTPRPASDQSGTWHTGNGTIDASDVTLSEFVTALETKLDRTIRDRTSITGRFDMRLRWAELDTTGDSDQTAPVLPTALREQLGLQLRSVTAAVDTLVVDSVETPSPSNP